MQQSGARIIGIAAGVCAAALLAVTASLAPHLASSSELVRLRNALVYQPVPADAGWNPAARPADFAVDSPPPAPLFTQVVRDERLRDAGADWPVALAAARHLLQGGKRHSEPIQADLATTYRRIVGEGRGYCGDYADVFIALAQAAGLHSRAWAFSFDGFGGHGHIFNEVWDSERERWVALDIHNNMLFLDAAGEPLSALALRALLARGEAPRLQRIRDDVRPGYVHADRALDYYRRGLPEWYLWWGSAVQAMDTHPLVRLLAPLGRPLEQLAALAAGVHPRLRVLHDEANATQRQALESLRLRLLALPWLALATLLLGLGWYRARRSARPAQPAR
jgi:hypothetical protein